MQQRSQLVATGAQPLMEHAHQRRKRHPFDFADGKGPIQAGRTQLGIPWLTGFLLPPSIALVANPS